MNRREREEAAIARIEDLGIEHSYTYNPDGRARRHVFAEKGLAGGRVVRGISALERYALEMEEEARCRSTKN